MCKCKYKNLFFQFVEHAMAFLPYLYYTRMYVIDVEKLSTLHHVGSDVMQQG